MERLCGEFRLLRPPKPVNDFMPAYSLRRIVDPSMEGADRRSGQNSAYMRAQLHTFYVNTGCFNYWSRVSLNLFITFIFLDFRKRLNSQLSGYFDAHDFLSVSQQGFGKIIKQLMLYYL